MELHDICNPIGFNNVGKFVIGMFGCNIEKIKE
jgi:hypothetical protein